MDRHDDELASYLFGRHEAPIQLIEKTRIAAASPASARPIARRRDRLRVRLYDYSAYTRSFRAAVGLTTDAQRRLNA